MTNDGITLIGIAALLAALGAASTAQAQAIPRVGNFGALLPDIPATTPLSAGEMALTTLSGLGGPGVEIAPGVIADRLVRPRCIFVANQNSGGGSVRQTAEIGRLQLYCP